MAEHSSQENLIDKVVEAGQKNLSEFKPADYQVGKLLALNPSPKEELSKMGFPDLKLNELPQQFVAPIDLSTWSPDNTTNASFTRIEPLKNIAEISKLNDSSKILADSKPAESISGLGRFLMSRQEAVARQRDTIGYCWPAVADVYDLSHPKSKASGFSAKDASATFARDSRFKELPNTSDAKVDTNTMQPGCVVILTPSQRGVSMGHPHGHIFVYMGKGEIVDGPDNRPRFIPQEKMKDPSKALPVEASDHLEYIRPKQIYDYSKTRIFKPVSDQV